MRLQSPMASTSRAPMTLRAGQVAGGKQVEVGRGSGAGQAAAAGQSAGGVVGCSGGAERRWCGELRRRGQSADGVVGCGGGAERRWCGGLHGTYGSSSPALPAVGAPAACPRTGGAPAEGVDRQLGGLRARLELGLRCCGWAGAPSRRAGRWAGRQAVRRAAAGGRRQGGGRGRAGGASEESRRAPHPAAAARTWPPPHTHLLRDLLRQLLHQGARRVAGGPHAHAVGQRLAGLEGDGVLGDLRGVGVGVRRVACLPGGWTRQRRQRAHMR